MLRAFRTAAAVLGASGSLCAVATAGAAVTPGWECIPTTAGQTVVSGGTGATPSCGTATTPVLAPTYVSSGVGGKPTAQFSSVNVQIVSGTGATDGTVNGEGNLVVGYAENTKSFPQTGSNDLIVGSNNGWSSFGQLVGGTGNNASGSSSAAFGTLNTATGANSFVAGHSNKATGIASAVGGGSGNQAAGTESSVTGGEFNLAFGPFSSISGGCQGVVGIGTAIRGTCGSSGYESISGGFDNRATALGSSVSAGEQLGLDVFAIGEHHRPDFLISSPVVALAAIAARTERIRLSSAVTVLSSDDPVRVFQQFAELDLISGGRAEIMAGRGSFIESFPLFGYDLDDYDELYAEKLELLLAIRESTA